MIDDRHERSIQNSEESENLPELRNKNDNCRIEGDSFSQQLEVVRRQVLDDLNGNFGLDWEFYGPSWRVAMSIIVASDQSWKCISCGCDVLVIYTSFPIRRVYGIASDGVKCHLHHKNRNHQDNRRENLEVRCPSCHALIHRHQRNAQMRLIERRLEVKQNVG